MFPLLLAFLQEPEPASRPASTKPLAVGDEAPDFTLRDEADHEVRLSSFRGKGKVLLAFYPKDFTPG
jgi:peroxiredoxin